MDCCNSRQPITNAQVGFKMEPRWNQVASKLIPFHNQDLGFRQLMYICKMLVGKVHLCNWCILDIWCSHNFHQLYTYMVCSLKCLKQFFKKCINFSSITMHYINSIIVSNILIQSSFHPSYIILIEPDGIAATRVSQ